MSDRLKVYFMGTGDIAVPVLKALVDSDRIELVGVCTQPDRAKGRKKILTPSPLGAAAEVLGVDVVNKPITVNTPEFVAHLKDLSPDVVVVIAFGQLLKADVLNLPKFGCINLHASILPKYRGASPINAVLLNGDSETGVTVMQIEKGLYTGPIT
jgi:methionyl-tRNA formyltransferase